MIKSIIIFILLFTFDNALMVFFPLQSLLGGYIVVPYLVLIGVCLHPFFDDEKNHAFWLAIFFGLIYDMFGANLIGFYATIFPILVVTIKKRIVATTPVNFISIFYIVTVAITIIELILYVLAIFILGRTVSILDFVQHRLVATVVFNGLLLALFYLPLVKLLQPKIEKKVKTIMTDNTLA